ncbi:MAG: Fis family transcriptional regulator, partial [Lentisphaerae bacterium]|nr:Fis family transcriptional regulator [Lentisphaerota bacterium]
ENIIEQAFVLCRGGMIEVSHLPPELRPKTGTGASRGKAISLESIEKLSIVEALHRRNGNRKRAANDLGINVSTLYRKIKTFGIDAPQVDGRGRRRYC